MRIEDAKLTQVDLVIVVPGIAQPAGSKRSFIVRGKNGRPDRAATVDANPKQKSWQRLVRECAEEACAGRNVLLGPVELSAVFMLQRPKSHYGSGRNAGTIKATAPYYVATRPDLDKLMRAIGDALTGVVWRDDAQVAWLREVGKIYTEGPALTKISVRLLARGGRA